MTTMLERAVEALHASMKSMPGYVGELNGIHATDEEGEPIDPAHMTLVDVTAHMPTLVRAVLMAIREPDETVREKLEFGGYCTGSSWGGADSFDYVSRDDVSEFSRDLIDAILNEETK